MDLPSEPEAELNPVPNVQKTLLIHPPHLRGSIRAKKLQVSGVPGVELILESILSDSPVLLDWAMLHSPCAWVLITLCNFLD